MECFLWLLFLVPGVIYSIWRIASRYAGCPVCLGKNCIPIGSPVAQSFLERQQLNQQAGV